MKILLPVLIAIFSNTASAFDYFNVVHQTQNEKGKQVLLQAEDCSPLKKQVNELSLMTSNPSINYQQVINSSGKKVCQVNISSLLPNNILTNDESTSNLNGPNCWSTALKTKRINQSFRFVQDKEFTFWLNSPYCRQVVRSDVLPGDIVAIRNRDSKSGKVNEVHGQIYLSSNLVFSKRTSGASSSFEVIRASLEYSSGTFRVPEECFKGEQNGICKTWTDYYRCYSPQNDKQSLANSLPLYSEISSKVDSLGATISQEALYGTAERLNEQKESLLEQLNHLEQKLPKISSTRNKSSDVLWQGLSLKIDSLKRHLKLKKF